LEIGGETYLGSMECEVSNKKMIKLKIQWGWFGVVRKKRERI
jgi:hypothetical protein